MTTATPREQSEQEQGHAAHTQAADRPEGLSGRFDRPIKITMLGAGSNFTLRLVNDVMCIAGADRGEIALVDVDAQPLKTMHQLAEKVVQAHGREGGWSVTASEDRRQVMADSDYLICCVEVSGVDCVAHDNDIALQYGVDQCIGDTIGPGGLFKALRTVPVFLDILRDVRELCPRAMVLNYTNPMNIMCLAGGRTAPEIPIVGLCHSVQGTSHLLARYADVEYERMTWDCAGINHLAWFTTLEHGGEDLYQSVLYDKFEREVQAGLKEAEQGLARYDNTDTKHNRELEKPYEQEDLVRKDMCLNFGAFITESSGHLSEYLPYYRKSEQGRKLLRLGYHGGSRFYATNWPQWRDKKQQDRMEMVRGEKDAAHPRSWEYASWIIEAREKDQPYRIHGNVMNAAPHSRGEGGKLITNLPGDGCVELACLIDRAGLHPTRYGALPPQMAHICRSNMAMFDLAAEAAIRKSKEHAVHALMLDPLTSAVCTPRQIRRMTHELFEAEQEFLPGYQ